jgi:hypothetical protein
MEQAILFDLEHFVARVLEREGGYRGVDPHLSMEIARRSIAAHKARRVVEAGYVRETVGSGPVVFNLPDHERYLSMISAANPAVRPMRPVTVAILDSAFDLQDADKGVVDRIEYGILDEDQVGLPLLAHGAVTASIIGTVAPTARIIVYPVIGGGALVHEILVGISLDNAVKVSKADVVVMCLQLTERGDVPGGRGALRKFLDGVTDRPVIIAAAGNRRDGEPEAARYPAIHRVVMMVGAVDAAKRSTEYSCFAYHADGDKPAMHMVSPGGSDPIDFPDEYAVTVHGHRFAGTSIAAAYAAGVIARSMAAAETTPERGEVYSRMPLGAEFIQGWDEAHYGKGLIREVAFDV